MENIETQEDRKERTRIYNSRGEHSTLDFSFFILEMIGGLILGGFIAFLFFGMLWHVLGY